MKLKLDEINPKLETVILFLDALWVIPDEKNFDIMLRNLFFCIFHDYNEIPRSRTCFILPVFIKRDRKNIKSVNYNKT